MYSPYDDDAVRAMHPRQAAVLMPLSTEERRAVYARACLLQNLMGGIFSGALSSAAADLRRVGLTGMEALDRTDNRSALAACGCGACSNDLR